MHSYAVGIEKVVRPGARLHYLALRAAALISYLTCVLL